MLNYIQSKAHQAMLIAGLSLTCTSPMAADSPKQVVLIIKQVAFYGDSKPDDGEEVHIKAIVNDTVYSLVRACCHDGHALLLKTEKSFPLPNDSNYSVRFELLRPGMSLPSSSNTIRRYNAKSAYISTQPDPARRWLGLIPVSIANAQPISGEYPLYEVRNGTREAAVSAVVHYQLALKTE